MQRFLVFHANATMGIEIKADEIVKDSGVYRVMASGQLVGQFDVNKISGWVKLPHIVQPNEKPFGFDDTDVTFH